MHIHFIAIGGAAMHQLAIALKNKGYHITGSDDAIYEPSYSELLKNGILPQEMGWFPEKISSQTDAIILGMHAKKDNPELLKAQEIGIKIYSYPEFIFEMSKEKTRVVIAGSHGKTTITAMVLHVLYFHGKEVDYMIGAPVEGFQNMVHLTDENDFIILEGDEYLSSPIDARPKFLHYQPNIALISGIAWDHINVFRTEEEYNQQFKSLIENLTPGGILVYNEEDAALVEIVENAENYFRKMPYTTPNYETKNGNTFLETEMGPLPLNIFGKHNLSNLEGAKVVCSQLGILEDEFYEAITSFKGAQKRLQKIDRKDGGIVYRDFAHAPSKVKASASAFAEKFCSIKKTAFLELHTYSSLTPEFLTNYSGTLDQIEETIVFFDEEALRIKNMPSLSETLILNSFGHPNMKVFTETSALHEYWRNLPKENTAFLMMSSGNFASLDLLG